MKLKQLLHSVRQSLKSSRRPVERPTKRRRQLLLEGLEDRIVPTLLFRPVFGSEDPIQNPGNALHSPTANFIFWGSYWNTFQGGQYKLSLLATSQEYFNSPILQGEEQYGSDGLSYYHVSWVESSDPPADFNSDDNQTQNALINTAIQVAIDTPGSPIPNPGATTNPVYLVVLPPTPGGGGGWNEPGTYNGTPIHMIMLTTRSNDVYSFSVLLSHEFQECVAAAVVVSHPPGLPQNLNGDFQICDNEPNGVYVYHLSGGAYVQAYWSESAGQYMISDGNSQTLLLNPIWTILANGNAHWNGQYDLTIDGDQLVALGGSANDYITIDSNGLNGVSVTMNGEQWQFGTNEIHSITINTGSGNDSVNVVTTGGAPVTVNLGNGTDTVEIGSGFVTLNDLGANVQVNGGTGIDTLNIRDQLDSNNDTYTMTSSSLTRTGAPTISYNLMNTVSIYGGQGNETYLVQGTEPVFLTNIYCGSTANTVNVLRTSGVLDVVGASLNDVVNIGNNSSVQGILGDVHVTNPTSYSLLNVDDSADTTGRVVTITNAYIAGLAPATIYYAQNDLLGLNIKAGSGNSTLSVLSTPDNPNFDPVQTSLSSQGFDTVNVGNAGSVQGIQGLLTIDNPPRFDTLNVNDSADTTARTTTLSTFTPAGDTSFGSISGLAPGDINYENADTTVTIQTGKAVGNVVNILATGTVTNLVGDANTSVNVGNVGSVQGITATLNIENPLSYTTITVDDSADSTPRTTTLSTLGTNPADSQANIDSYGQIGGLAPANINYEYLDTTSLTVKTGTAAGNVVNVQATGVSTNLVGNAATAINVGKAGNAQSIWGSLSLSGPANSINLTVDDSADALGRTATLASSSLTGISPDAINFTAGMMKSLAILAGSGNDSLTVSAAPTFTTTVDLGGGSNTLTGPNATNTWTITAANHGTLGSKLTFSNVQNLVGGTGNDTFKFKTGGSMTGTINGGGGTDTVDYSPVTAPITVNLQTGAATFTGGFSNINNLIGGGAAVNTLIGANTNNVWNISAAATGNINGVFNFSDIDALVGGTGVDVFAFTAAASKVTSINGGSPTGDWLDYSSYTAAVSANLQTGKATGVSGTVSNIQNVHGGNFGNMLTGNAQGNILIGGSGTNTIKGGSGRSILMADAGKSAITGGSGGAATGGDIMIGGRTTFDTMTSVHEAALQSILNEWQSGDSATDRFLNIMNGTGGGSHLNGGTFLNWTTTVLDNGKANTLTAQAGAGEGVDWFFANEAVGHTKVVGREAGDYTNNT